MKICDYTKLFENHFPISKMFYCEFHEMFQNILTQNNTAEKLFSFGLLRNGNFVFTKLLAFCLKLKFNILGFSRKAELQIKERVEF